jgi:hypothetical protein
LFDATGERNEGKKCGCTDGRSDSDARCPGSPASELPHGHENDGTEYKEQLEAVHEGRGITRHVCGKRTKQEADNENDDKNTYAQKGLREISRERGQSDGGNKENKRERELDQEKPAKIREYRKTCVNQEEKLHIEERYPDDDKEEEEFGKEKLPPNVGLGDPPLAIANESFALDDTKDEEDPRKYKEKRDVTARKVEKEG